MASNGYGPTLWQAAGGFPTRPGHAGGFFRMPEQTSIPAAKFIAYGLLAPVRFPAAGGLSAGAIRCQSFPATSRRQADHPAVRTVRRGS